MLYVSDSGGSSCDSNIFKLTSTLDATPEFLGCAELPLTDVAWDDLTQTLFAVDSASQLYQLDAQSGLLEPIGPTGFALNALTFCQDTLYAWGNNTLVSLDLLTGRATLVGSVGYVSSGDLACSSDGVLYGTASGTTHDRLIRFNRSTGKGSLVAELTFSTGLGLDFDSNGALYAFTGSIPSEVYRLNALTGAVEQLVGYLPLGQAVYGAALNTKDISGCTLEQQGTKLYYPDADLDGYGETSNAQLVCLPPEGYTSLPGDCNDQTAQVFPGNLERCDQLDNNCDGNIDESAQDAVQCFVDGDGDGIGLGVPFSACACPAGYSSQTGDCLDTQPLVYPGAQEICDGYDNNCNGQLDEGVSALVYPDEDQDGYGDALASDLVCLPLEAGSVQVGGDCNDQDPLQSPAQPEICDGIDQDCNGVVDDGLLTVYYADQDGDGFGDASSSLTACTCPAGYVTSSDDCLDTDPQTSPAEADVRDGRDNNCNGLVDEPGVISGTQTPTPTSSPTPEAEVTPGPSHAATAVPTSTPTTVPSSTPSAPSSETPLSATPTMLPSPAPTETGTPDPSSDGCSCSVQADSADSANSAGAWGGRLSLLLLVGGSLHLLRRKYHHAVHRPRGRSPDRSECLSADAGWTPFSDRRRPGSRKNHP